MATRVPVTFEPAGVTAWVNPGVTLSDAARQAGIVVAAPCGGRGVCGSCGVVVVKGELAPADAIELAGLRRAKQGVRLACRAKVAGPVSVRPLLFAPMPAVAHPGELGVERGGPIVAGVDLGTTSVAAALIDVETGVELARASVPNRQQSYGADILTRLSAAAEGSRAGLRILAEESILDALGAAARSAGARLDSVERVTIAGNSAMAALLTGVDTTSLSTFPFVAPPTGGALPIESAVPAALAPGAKATLLPPIAGFVGGDALAAAVAAGMLDSHEPVLLVDFGTNAEIVMAVRGRLTVASAAAGPAFEGGGIACGGPAAVGAITRVHIGDAGSIYFETIGGRTGEWFSGSGLVSGIAELRRARAIDESGRLLTTGLLADRVSVNDAGVAEVRLGIGESGGPRLTQLDIRSFQLAKAAVRVGIEAVLDATGVDGRDISRVCVAGAFGVALAADDLVSLGVMPASVLASIVPVGNAALDGAAQIALDASLGVLAERAARNALHVELAANPDFAHALVDATALARFHA